MKNVWEVDFKRVTDQLRRGEMYICRGDGTGIVPFDMIRPFCVINPTSEDVTRGGHSHNVGWQIHFCTFGQVIFDLNDGVEEKTIVLSDPANPLVIGPGVWHTYILRPNSSLMALASNPYREEDYIRDFEEFKAGTRRPK